ncbi:hypothetical protein C8R44DRAFT_723813 [Mycena epipterygia]|nr:hypothetical protein C8R44DRAFT_723813 [Mycena epipterygia]
MSILNPDADYRSTPPQAPSTAVAPDSTTSHAALLDLIDNKDRGHGRYREAHRLKPEALSLNQRGMLASLQISPIQHDGCAYGAEDSGSGDRPAPAVSLPRLPRHFHHTPFEFPEDL